MINLLQGDCLELLKGVQENTFDMICADMPYGTTKCKWDTVIDLDKLWPELKRVSKQNAAIVLFAQTPFDKVLGCSNLEMLRYEWIWEKPSATGFFNAKKMPLKAHENILVFYKKLPTYNYIKTYGHERKTASKGEQKSPVYGKAVKKTLYNSTERYPRSIQSFSSDKQRSRLHPTQKPEALIEYLIRTYTNEGDNVLDFCMGSGTAGVAAVKLNRKFTGMDLDHAHFNTASTRIHDASQDLFVRCSM